MGVRHDHQQILLRTIGDPDMTMLAPRSHVVTGRDLRPAWRAEGSDLPFTCAQPGRYRQIRICAGRIPRNADVTLRLGLSQGRAQDAVIYANRKRATLIGETEIRPAYFDHPAYAFRVENDGRLPVYLVLEITTHGQPFTVDYLEVRVELKGEII